MADRRPDTVVRPVVLEVGQWTGPARQIVRLEHHAVAGWQAWDDQDRLYQQHPPASSGSPAWPQGVPTTRKYSDWVTAGNLNVPPTPWPPAPRGTGR